MTFLPRTSPSAEFSDPWAERRFPDGRGLMLELDKPRVLRADLFKAIMTAGKPLHRDDCRYYFDKAIRDCPGHHRCGWLRTEAPPRGALRFVPEGDEDIVPLRKGIVDLNVGTVIYVGPEVKIQTLFRDRFIGAVGTERPLAKGKVTLERFVKCPHVGAARRGRNKESARCPFGRFWTVTNNGACRSYLPSAAIPRPCARFQCTPQVSGLSCRRCPGIRERRRRGC